MSLVPPPPRKSLASLIESSEISTDACSKILNSTSDTLCKRLTKIPREEALLVIQGFNLLEQVFTGGLSPSLASEANRNLAVNTLLLNEKNLTHRLVESSFNILVTLSKSSISTASRSVQNIFVDFQKKYILDIDEGIDYKCFENNFYLDKEFILNSDFFNSLFSKKKMVLFKLEIGSKRCVFLHDLLKPLVIDQNGKDFFQRNIPKHPFKSVVFLTFLEAENLTLVDVKLKSLEDPCFENKIREDFKNYLESLPFLQPEKKATQVATDDKMAFALAALKDELDDESSAKAPKKTKKTPQPRDFKEPTPQSNSITLKSAITPKQRDLLTTVRTISKQEALSPEWKKVEVAKKSVELSPSKAFQKIINNETTLSLKSRVLRWLTLESLDQVKQFQDMQSQSPAKKLVKRYEKMTSEELFTQVLRHTVPSCLLPVFASPDFRRLYCYQKDGCYYVKARISMPSINFNEETIVSFAFNPQNQLYHFFIHPQNEIQFDKDLSDIPRFLDSTSEELSTESLPDHLLEELTGISLEGLNSLAILAKYKHPTNQNPLDLCLIPRN